MTETKLVTHSFLKKKKKKALLKTGIGFIHYPKPGINRAGMEAPELTM